MKPAHILIPAATMLLAALASAHSHMALPKSRTRESFPDTQDKFACDSDSPRVPLSYAPGDEVEVVWPRNNHFGGFIRYSIVPKDAVSKKAFDANAFHYTCIESQCSLKQCKEKFCFDDPGSVDGDITCRAKIKLPEYLEKGEYVLQWLWHSAGSMAGHIGWGPGNFKSCVDIELTSSGTGKMPACPTFAGGDRLTFMEKNLTEARRTGQCFFFVENGVGNELIRFDDSERFKGYAFGIPKQVEECGGGGASPPAEGNSSVPVLTGSPPSQPRSLDKSSSKEEADEQAGKPEDRKKGGDLESTKDADGPGTVTPRRENAEH